MIILGPKRIENRTWRPPSEVIGTRILIHAGKGWDSEAAGRLSEWYPELVEIALHNRGLIVGSVLVTGVVGSSEDEWFTGPFGWTLAHPIAFCSPIASRGMLGLWKPSDFVTSRVRMEERRDIDR